MLPCARIISLKTCKRFSLRHGHVTKKKDVDMLTEHSRLVCDKSWTACCISSAATGTACFLKGLSMMCMQGVYHNTSCILLDSLSVDTGSCSSVKESKRKCTLPAVLLRASIPRSSLGRLLCCHLNCLLSSPEQAVSLTQLSCHEVTGNSANKF